MTVFNKLVVNGVQISDTRNLTLTRSISDNNATSRLEFDVDNWAGFHKSDFPQAADVTLACDLDVNPAVTTIFGGIVSEVDFSGVGSNKEKMHVICRDYTSLLQKNTVDPEIYTNAEISTIVTNLMSKYAPLNFTVTNVQVTGVTLSRMTFKRVNLFDALKQLADLANGWFFYVDQNKDLHFAPKATVSSGLTFNNTNVVKADFVTDQETVKNRVYVYGARQLVAAPTETFTADGAGSVFTLTQAPSNTKVQVSGVFKKGGIYQGTQNATSGPDYLVSYNDKQIIFVSGTGYGYNTIPGSLVQVAVDYQASRPIVKLAEDFTSIYGVNGSPGYGKRTMEVIDTTIVDPVMALNIAKSQLALNKDPKTQGTLQVQGLANATPGQTCVVDFPYHGQNLVTMNIVESKYVFTPENSFANKVLTVKVGQRIPDITDVYKNLVLANKQLQAAQVDTAAITTRLITGAGSVGLNIPQWSVATRQINDSFVVGHPINGVIGIVNPTTVGSLVGLAPSGHWISGIMNTGWDKAFAFDSGARIFVPDSNGVTDVGSKDNYSISFWYAKSGATNDCSISEHWEQSATGYPWAFRTATNLRFGVYDGTLNPIANAPAGSYSEGNWHHVVGVRNWTAGSIFLYVDNVLAASTKDTTNGNVKTGSHGFAIGARASNGNNSFVGSIDDFRVYNHALSTTEIGSLFSKVNYTPGLIALYKFDEGIGSSAYNSASVEMPTYDALMHFNFNKAGSVIADNVGSVTGSIFGVVFDNGVYGNGSAIASAGSPNYMKTSPISFDTTASNYTFTAWVYPSGTQGNVGVVNCQFPNIGLDVRKTAIGAWLNGQSTVVAATLNDYTWYHVAAVYHSGASAQSRNIYLNGSYIGDDNANGGTSIVASKNLYMGYDPTWGGYSSAFAGKIDEARLYARALGSVEIRSLYNGKTIQPIVGDRRSALVVQTSGAT